jgi:signal transduction histidine kinase
VPVGTTADRAFKLQIVDSGCGIPANVLSQLGNAFVQADNTFARKHQGTGLGLAICFGLAKQIRASIQIASTENVGTTVSLLLPMSDLKMKDAGSSRVQVSAA